jgi:hypothetical protein
MTCNDSWRAYGLLYNTCFVHHWSRSLGIFVGLHSEGEWRVNGHLASSYTGKFQRTATAVTVERSNYIAQVTQSLPLLRMPSSSSESNLRCRPREYISSFFCISLPNSCYAQVYHISNIRKGQNRASCRKRQLNGPTSSTKVKQKVIL